MNHQQLLNAANDWRYLQTLNSIGLTGREAIRHSMKTTKGDLDTWLMAKFNLSPTEARDISNYSMEQVDFKTGRPGEVKWIAKRLAPTFEQYPELQKELS